MYVLRPLSSVTVLVLLFTFAAAFGQQIPPQTALPVMLNSTLDAKKDKPGEKIEGKVMQDVALDDGNKIGHDSRVLGHIIDVKAPGGAAGSSMTIAFDQIEDHGKSFDIKVFVRALASMEAVYQAQLPLNADSQYVGEDSWITAQIGGEKVDRAGRRVIANGEVVGKAPAPGMVIAKLRPAADCPGSDGGGREQALWIFSTTACGVYGLSDIKIAHAGRTPPVGEVELQSTKDLLVRGGSGWLLLTVAAAGR
jgi:hypothetical protein